MNSSSVAPVHEVGQTIFGETMTIRNNTTQSKLLSHNFDKAGFIFSSIHRLIVTPANSIKYYRELKPHTYILPFLGRSE